MELLSLLLVGPFLTKLPQPHRHEDRCGRCLANSGNSSATACPRRLHIGNRYGQDTRGQPLCSLHTSRTGSSGRTQPLRKETLKNDAVCPDSTFCVCSTIIPQQTWLTVSSLRSTHSRTNRVRPMCLLVHCPVLNASPGNQQDGQIFFRSAQIPVY
jgi:hypothetical protein